MEKPKAESAALINKVTAVDLDNADTDTLAALEAKLIAQLRKVEALQQKKNPTNEPSYNDHGGTNEDE